MSGAPAGPSLAALTAITLMWLAVGATMTAAAEAWAGYAAALTAATAGFVGWLIHIAIAGNDR